MSRLHSSEIALLHNLGYLRFSNSCVRHRPTMPTPGLPRRGLLHPFAPLCPRHQHHWPTTTPKPMASVAPLPPRPSMEYH
uniref:Uncharacterized protein n=1 Tax=Oryza brachyantha TaxID=4533 RepID=J3M821_ORYBR